MDTLKLQFLPMRMYGRLIRVCANPENSVGGGWGLDNAFLVVNVFYGVPSGPTSRSIWTRWVRGGGERDCTIISRGTYCNLWFSRGCPDLLSSI